MAEEDSRSESDAVVLDETASTEPDDMEAKIEAAMSARVDYFKAQADSLTFGKVRRLLEEDMGLEKFALDCQKIFIKQNLLECIHGPTEDSKKSGEAGDEDAFEENKDLTESHLVATSKNDANDSNANDEEKMGDSPVMGLMAVQKAVESQGDRAEGNVSQEVLCESRIKKAVRRRASYIKANLEKLTTAEVRRLLEDDLGVEKFALDPFKKFILGEIDELVNAPEGSESAKEAKKKRLKKAPQRKAPKKVSSDQSADSLDSETEEVERDIEEPRKKKSTRGKLQNPEGPRKRKRPADETKVSGKKRIEPSKSIPEDKSDAEDNALSEDGNSQSSNEKPMKKREASTPSYGKRVERLKSVIKSCGMSVPPSVYKKAKQEPENKRETRLIKELEGILSKEGLSSSPSEKEIKEVKKRKERAKELEGIDMSNIVTSSRRRSVSNFLPPPKPKQPVESDSDAENTDESGEGDADEDDEEVEEEEEDEEEGGDDDENQSEESDDDKDSD